MTHELKLLTEYFEEVKKGTKTFELRKDDRNYKTGDTLVLMEYNNNGLTGEQINKKISYILRNAPEYGLDKDYCILSLVDV